MTLKSRRFLSLILAIAMVITMMPASALAHNEEGTETELKITGITVLGSSGETDAGESADKMFDSDNQSTKWCQVANTGWAVFKTPAPVNINMMKGYHATQSTNTWDKNNEKNTKAYALQVYSSAGEPSTEDYSDDSKWITAGEETENTDGIKETAVNMASPAQFFRLKVNHNGTESGNAIRIYGLELYEKKTSEELTNPVNISFAAGDGAEGIMNSVRVEKGTEYTLPACEFTKADNSFAGWSIPETESVEQPGEKITVNSDMTLTATWKSKEYVNISFNENGAESTMAQQRAEKNKVYTLPDCEMIPPAGKIFAGWMVDGNEPVKMAGEKVTLTKDISLTATWKTKPFGPERPAKPADESLFVIDEEGIITDIAKDEDGDYYSLPENLLVPSQIGGITVKGIGSKGFTDSYGKVKNVWLPDTVKTIAEDAFLNMRYCFEYLDIGDGVESLGDRVLNNNDGLKNVRFGKSLNSFLPGDSVFNTFTSCTNLKNIEVDAENTTYQSKDGVVYSKDGKTLIMVPRGRTGEVTVAEGTTTVGNGAFNYSNLETVKLPASVTSIESYVFNSCYRLGEIQFAGSTAQWEAVTKGEEALPYYVRIKTSEGYVLNDVKHAANDKQVTYDGSEINIADMFTLDKHAGKASYTVTGGTGKATINGTNVKVTKAGTVKVKAATEATEMYKAGETEAVLTVNPKDIIVIPKEQHLTYDDNAAISEDVSRAGTSGLCGSDMLTEVTLKADKDKNLINASGAVIKDTDGTDVTGNYNITYQQGKITRYHEWGKPVFAFADNGRTCMVTRTDKHNKNVKETVEAAVTLEIKEPATCESRGTTVYTATVVFDNETYTETKELKDIKATGHSYRETTYSWNSDYTECTATRVCENDEKHTETETAAVKKTVKKATCEEGGETKYTAEFKNPWAEKQTKITDVTEAAGHKWNKPEITFAEDGKTAIAKVICENDKEHVKNLEVVVTSEVKTPATSEKMGVTVYTATAEFNGEKYTATKEVTDIPVEVPEKPEIKKEEVVQKKLDKVPASLEKKFDTVEKVEEALEEVILKNFGTRVNKENVKTQLFDAVLMITENGVRRPATKEEIEARGGITLTIPYPEGTDRENYIFAVAHMLTTAMNGMEAGDIEYPDFTLTEEGIRVTLKGLSPVMVAYTEKTAAPVKHETKPADKEKKEETPETGDESNMIPWILVLAAAIAGAGSIAGRKKEDK